MTPRENASAGAGGLRRLDDVLRALKETYGFAHDDIGISMDGRAPIADIPAQARAAEEGGAATLWIACHLFLRDPITTAAHRARRDFAHQGRPDGDEPLLGASRSSPRWRRRRSTRCFPAGWILCLGAGAPADLKAAGMEATKPLDDTREAIAVWRALFAGQPIEFEAKRCRCRDGGWSNGGRRLPIVLAASRPNMLAAGRRGSMAC